LLRSRLNKKKEKIHFPIKRAALRRGLGTSLGRLFPFKYIVQQTVGAIDVLRIHFGLVPRCKVFIIRTRRVSRDQMDVSNSCRTHDTRVRYDITTAFRDDERSRFHVMAMPTRNNNAVQNDFAATRVREHARGRRGNRKTLPASGETRVSGAWSVWCAPRSFKGFQRAQAQATCDAIDGPTRARRSLGKRDFAIRRHVFLASGRARDDVRPRGGVWLSVRPIVRNVMLRLFEL